MIFCSCIDLGCEILEPFFKVSLTLSELLARQRKKAKVSLPTASYLQASTSGINTYLH